MMQLSSITPLQNNQFQFSSEKSDESQGSHNMSRETSKLEVCPKIGRLNNLFARLKSTLALHITWKLLFQNYKNLYLLNAPVLNNKTFSQDVGYKLNLSKIKGRLKDSCSTVDFVEFSQILRQFVRLPRIVCFTLAWERVIWSDKSFHHWSRRASFTVTNAHSPTNSSQLEKSQWLQTFGLTRLSASDHWPGKCEFV